LSLYSTSFKQLRWWQSNDSNEIGFIGLAILAVLLLLAMDVGYTMLFTGFLGYALIAGWGGALTNLAILPFDTVNNYTFAVLPLFMLMGMLVSKGKIGAEAYDMARTWFGQFKGGLAIATIFACGLLQLFRELPWQAHWSWAK